MTSAIDVRPGASLGQADYSRPETYVKLAAGALFAGFGLYNVFRSREPIAMAIAESPGGKGKDFLVVPHSDFLDTLTSVAAIGGGAFILADAFGVELLGGRG